MKIKIAIDSVLGWKRCDQLEKLGYNIVVIAGEAESDSSWMKRASDAGATFVISNDSDIPRLIERESYPMVWVDFPTDREFDKSRLVIYVHKVIRFKLLMFEKILSEAV